MILQMKKGKVGEKYNPTKLLLKGERFIEEKSKSHPEESIAERVKLRRQKGYDKELFDTSPSTDNYDEYTDMPALEGDEEEIKQ